MPCTVVAFNAHPDDEALLTGGTLAMLSAQGHRVVLVTATDGGEGLSSAAYRVGAGLGTHRRAELEASAAALGAAEVVHLGYADSGHDGPVPPDPPGCRRFVNVPTQEAADQLAAVLRREAADLLIGYDEAGGYGHRDHLKAHRVARAAAAAAGTSRLVEATVPRERILRTLRAIGTVYRFPGGFTPDEMAQAYTPLERITHHIDVRPHLSAKRAALRAHASQASGDDAGAARTLAAVLRLPRPLSTAVLGREYFVDPQLPPGTVHTDLLQGLR